MRSLLAFHLTAAVACAGPGPVPGDSAAGPGRHVVLAKADRELLDSLFRDFLFDPRGAIRVRIPAEGRRLGMFQMSGETRCAWLVPGRRGESGRLYFRDRGEYPVPPASQIRAFDFIAAYRERYYPSPSDDARRRPKAHDDEDSDLVRAAWLHRLGHDDLAARALAAARTRSKDDPRQAAGNGELHWWLRSDLARQAFDAMHEAFCRRADAEALAHGERFYCLYPDFADTQRHAKTIYDDLVRRQSAGRGGRGAPVDLPKEFDSWEARTKLAYLIDTLDEIDTPERYADFSLQRIRDRRVEALVAIGELAVPALLDVVETDSRLTRLPEIEGRWKTPTGRMVSVREEAEVAIQAILRVAEFDPTVTDRRESPTPEVRAARMRTYWETYGRLAFDERMMKVLTDPNTSSRACREAAENLARWHWEGRHRWDRSSAHDDVRAWRPNPAVRKFAGPTAAAAILAAMDRDRRARDLHGDEKTWERWPSIEEEYLDCLVDLGDARIAPELVRRASRTEDVAQRRRFACAAHRLGTSAALLNLARAIEQGTLPLAREADGSPGDRETAEQEMRANVDILAGWQSDDADRALNALADADHPYSELVADAILDMRDEFERSSPYRRHPFVLALLRRKLDDTRGRGRHFYLRGDEIEESTRRRTRCAPLPEHCPGPGAFLEHAEECVCDVAAQRLSDILAGAPDHHPLRKDAGQSIATLKALLDRHRGRFRSLTGAELAQLGFRQWEPAYAPDIAPLGRPANAADVAAGRAVFHLHGRGKPIAGPLPTWLTLKADVGKVDASRRVFPAFSWSEVPRSSVSRLSLDQGALTGLVVQAETDADGKIVYGVIFRNSIRTIRADEVEKVERDRGK